MKILVLGAGRIGAKVIRQLRKNKDIVISALDYSVDLRPFELEPIIREVKPDLVLVTTSPEDISRSVIPGLDILVDALSREIETAFSVPVIAVSRTGIK